ncbi:hypothetical protein DL93DRAFT_2153686 [Clavulina sp. PMI_390]|nr:hypothetical protein DL93DRAFT_2153686 [Clavulina sp. PMI_390]
MSSPFPQDHVMPVVDKESKPGEGTRPKHWVWYHLAKVPRFLSTPVTAALCFVLVMIGISLEVVLWKSNKNNGFASISSFVNISANEASQFLKSFVPNLIFVPVLYVMRKSYQELKVLQPYVELSHGSVPPEFSITSRYASQSPLSIIRTSWTRRQWVLTSTSLVLLWSGVFSSFAGSLFTVRLSQVTSTIPVNSAGAVGFNNIAFGSPATFVAAAGGIDSLILEGQKLPTFIFKDGGSVTSGWTLAAFKPGNEVDISSNGTSFVFLETQAINMHVQCLPANISSLTAGSDGESWSFVASLSSTCSETYNGTITSDFTSWLGVMADANPSCINTINPNVTVPSNLPVTQNPISMGFIANRTSASAAFCYATQTVYTGLAGFDLVAGQLVNITNLKPDQNNSLNGFAYNGVRFTNSFAQSTIANAVGLAVGDAVINNAGINPKVVGIDEEQQNRIIAAGGEALVPLVENALLIYLLSAASRILVGSTAITGQGSLVVEEARLHAYAPSVHSLAILCILSGLLFAFAFVIHARERRGLYLVDRPGTTVGAVAAMLSDRSSFISFLTPLDTMKDIDRKLEGKTFGLNPHTGAIEFQEEVNAHHGENGGSKPESREY